MDIYLVANSPGEICGFVKPVLRRLKERLPQARLTAILLPCTFSTGRGKEGLAGFFVKNEHGRERLLKLGVAGEKIHLVGDLVADEVMDALTSGPEAPLPE